MIGRIEINGISTTEFKVNERNEVQFDIDIKDGDIVVFYDFESKLNDPVQYLKYYEIYTARGSKAGENFRWHKYRKFILTTDDKKILSDIKPKKGF